MATNAATIEAIQNELATKEAEAAALRQALAVLTGGDYVLAVDARIASPRSKEYEGLGIVDAAIRFLTEVGEPRSTSDIKDALLARGWQTKSKNATATVYATLNNSKRLLRTNDGNWAIKEGKERS